jgi:regulator of sigma E protease
MGGYVKMLDEREAPVAPEDLPRSYMRRPPWQRILVLFAGPGFNILFAILVLWGMLWVNGTTSVRAVVSEVTASSPAARAGLVSGDEITAIDGRRVADQRDVLFDLLDSVLSHGSAQLAVQARSGASRQLTLAVTDPVERKRLAELSNLLGVLGFQMQGPVIPPIIGSVEPGGPAAHAGLRPGDRVVAVDGRPVHDFADMAHYVPAIPGKTIELRYARGAAEHTATITVATLQHGNTRQPGIGVVSVPAHFPPGLLVHHRLSATAALVTATNEAWDLTAVQGRLIWRMVLGQVSLKNLSGPIGIAQYAGESAEEGVTSFLSFLVLISLAIALFNLLPIPILDGGQIVFQAAEWVKGSPLSERTQAFGQQIGIALLVLLLGVAIFNDVSRQFG